MNVTEKKKDQITSALIRMCDFGSHYHGSGALLHRSSIYEAD